MHGVTHKNVNSSSVFLFGVGLSVFLAKSAFAAIPLPLAPTLNTPANGAYKVPQSNVSFSWSVSNSVAAKVNNYRIVISRDANFSGFTDNNGNSSCTEPCSTFTTGTSTNVVVNMRLAGQTYYWKVRANGSSGVGPWSLPRSFTTVGTSLSEKLDSFVKKWTGTPTDFDGVYGAYAYQCVDLMRRYANDVLGLNSELPTGNAYNIYVNTNSSKFSKIANTPTGVPMKGDIIFWKPLAANGNSGHVAIVVSGTVNSFTSFDQNYCKATGSGKGDCAPRLWSHNYSGVAGWLHPK